MPAARVALTALLVAACVGEANAVTLLQQRGQTLVSNMCAQCHAIDKNKISPHIGAPPFRELDRRLDLDAFVSRLREGLVSSHADMPMFRFSREDARAVVAYLRSIQGP
jgi:mono/diheme cytochrome c family protein